MVSKIKIDISEHFQNSTCFSWQNVMKHDRKACESSKPFPKIERDKEKSWMAAEHNHDKVIICWCN